MITKSSILLIVVVTIVATFSACYKSDNSWQLQSPDGNLLVSVEINPTDSSLYYTSDYIVDDNPVNALGKSSLGLVRNDMDFSKGLTFKSVSRKTIREDYSTITGKRINDTNHCNEMTISFENEYNQEMEIIFRAYDDGIAFRYHFPAEDTTARMVIDELSSFNLNSTSGKAWMQTYDTLLHWSLGYEIPYHLEIPIGTKAPVSYGWALPLLFEKENGLWVLVSEADLDQHYAGMHVKPDAPGGNYTLEFPEEYECYGLFSRYPSSTLPWTTPWRFAIIGPTPATLVESNMVNHLSRPTEYEDTDWIKPGISSWSWWSDPSSSMDYIPLKDHVDVSKEMGWKYSLVDADWDIMKNGNIDQLIDYAHSQDVELFIWYNSGGPNNRVMWYFNLTDEIVQKLINDGIPVSVLNKLKPIYNTGFFPEQEYYDKVSELLGDEHFDTYGEQIILAARNRNARPRDRFYEEDIRIKEFQQLKEKGVRGLKLDFFASDKQEIIKMYINIFEEAANNEILINTHGSTIPRGWSKTFPNLLTMEAVMGAEMYGTASWPDLAPVQNTVYPFLRNVVGEMDYTPFTLSQRLGGFPRKTSNAHELALTVHYETGLLHIAESAEEIRKLDNEVKEFLQTVPVVWDDIRFIDGYPADYSVLARRSGDKWYISGINGKTSTRQVSFTPSFLDEGSHEATYYLDGDREQTFQFENNEVTNSETITIDMKPLGGFVMVVE